MAINYHQLSLKDTFSDCYDMFTDDVPSFFLLLEQHFDFSLFIPQTFYHAFYQRSGCKRDYPPLTAFLSALILLKIFSVPANFILILLLHICKELRDFCGFPKSPMPRFLPDSNSVSRITLKPCSNDLLKTCSFLFLFPAP